MKKGILKRVVLVSIGTFFLLSVLIVQFFKIQIVDGEKWSEVARRQHFFTVQEPFLRGTFWSNTDIRKVHPEKAQRFVIEIQKFHLYVDPFSIPEKNRDMISEYLVDNLDLTPSEKLQMRIQFEKQSRSRKLAMWVDQETKDRILAWWNDYSKRYKIPRNALYFVAEYQRSYPFGKLLGQVLHTVQAQRDEVTKQAYPTGGLELYFDSYLKGKQGERLLKRSPRHSFETGQVLTSPENGADIFLTINHYLQAIAEEEIERGVKRCQGKGGWAVIMEPHTGEILALAQYPFFFPSKYNEYFNDEDLIDNAKVKAVTDANEPGSVIKAFTALTALLANQELAKRGKAPLFNTEEKMPCSNSSFPGRRKPLADVSFHKFMNMNMAIRKSSNIYFARLVEKMIDRLGNDWYRSILEEKFGFGIRTNIELVSESPGLLPRPGKLNPNGTLEWSVPTPFSLAIGYNLQLNSIQIARAYSLLANGGILVEPTLVKKIVKNSPDGREEVLLDNTTAEKIASFKRTVPEELVKRVVTAMRYTTKPGGSSRRADIWGYTEIGKSGTAHKIVNGQYSQTDFISSFVGFAPVNDPAFVLLVVMNEPKKGPGNTHHGSYCAAPVFKAIATRALEYLGVTPDDPHGYPQGDPRYDPNLGDWLPEAKKIQELYDSWNH
jgi:cell division protein FtsI (penicillin-binding protein 3)